MSRVIAAACAAAFTVGLALVPAVAHADAVTVDDGTGDVWTQQYDPETDEASPFEPHVGSHGGLGGPQQHGFLVHPRSFAAPGEVVGAEHLHRVFRGWLTDLGHPQPPGDAVDPAAAPAAPAVSPDRQPATRC